LQKPGEFCTDLSSIQFLSEIRISLRLFTKLMLEA
jgi:hypothetical protein